MLRIATHDNSGSRVSLGQGWAGAADACLCAAAELPSLSKRIRTSLRHIRESKVPRMFPAGRAVLTQPAKLHCGEEASMKRFLTGARQFTGP